MLCSLFFSILNRSLLPWLNHLNQRLLSDAQWQSESLTHKHLLAPAHYHVDPFFKMEPLQPHQSALNELPAWSRGIEVWLDNLFQSRGRKERKGGGGNDEEKVELDGEIESEETVILLIRKCEMTPWWWMAPKATAPTVQWVKMNMAVATNDDHELTCAGFSVEIWMFKRALRGSVFLDMLPCHVLWEIKMWAWFTVY